MSSSPVQVLSGGHNKKNRKIRRARARDVTGDVGSSPNKRKLRESVVFTRTGTCAIDGSDSRRTFGPRFLAMVFFFREKSRKTIWDI